MENKKRKAIVLISGGLDSTLAAKMMLEQGIEVEGINLQTVFECCKIDARIVAEELGIRIFFVPQGDKYFRVIEKPKHGYGRGMNPCVDCRAYMFRIAKHYMEKIGADFIVTGEVLGQRPNSQLSRSLRLVEEESGLQGLLLRPLSAHLLPETEPEKQGWVNREKLLGIQGRGRRPLIALADRLNVKFRPNPSTGCMLTEPGFSRKVKDLIETNKKPSHKEYELLKIGRHFRKDKETKFIVGRDSTENAHLRSISSSLNEVIEPDNFNGPAVYITQAINEELKKEAVQLILQFTRQRAQNEEPRFRRIQNDTVKERFVMNEIPSLDRLPESTQRI